VSEDSTALKTCPACAEQVQAAAVICRYCSHDFRGEVGRRTAATAPSKTSNRGKVGAVVLMVSAAILAIGAFLPWLALSSGLGSTSLNGLDTEGWGLAVLGLGFVLGLLGLRAYLNPQSRRLVGYVTIFLALAALVVVVLGWGEVDSRIREVESSPLLAKTGAGLGVAALGGLLALFAGGVLTPSRSKQNGGLLKAKF
jgi:hypothetical protein